MKNSTLNNARILIVDDEQANIDVLTGLLETQGYPNVKTLTDPRLVAGLYTGWEPDLILLDLAMPFLTGFQVLEQLKPLIKETTFLPILVLTADLTRDAKRKALAGGAKDFLTKPFDLIEVDLRIKNLLHTRHLHLLLENQNEILEEKVKERTLELEQSNKNLKVANEELQVLDQAKSGFLNVISHEIRTPLNAILGFTNLLKYEIDALEFQNFLGFLEASALRLAKFSIQALMITELRARKREIRREMVTMEELFDHALSQAGHEITLKGLNIVLHQDPAASTIHGDWELLKTCFASVVDYGVKYSPPSTDLVINTFRIDQGIVCEIIDAGIPFSTDALEDPFLLFGFREEHSDQNTGLYLALAKIIVDAHQGRIEVQNNQPKGATVRITLNN